MPYTKTAWVDNSTPDIDAANLNNIEDGISKAPYGPDASANFVPVWNGSAWVYQGIKNAEVDAAAAIAYSKLNLATSIVNADIAAGAAIAYTKLALTGTILDADISGSATNLHKLSAATGSPSASTFLRGDGAWAAAAATTYRKTTSKAVNTTVSETDLFNGEITIAANAIGASGLLRISAWGDWLQNAAAGAVLPRLKLKLGATTLIDTNTPGTSSGQSATRQPWRLTANILNLGATNSQLANFEFVTTATAGSTAQEAAFTTGTGIYHTLSWATSYEAIARGYNTAAVDTTASQALVFSVINGNAGAAYETKLIGAVLEVV